MIHRQEKNTPTTKSKRQPTNAIRAVKANAIFKNANSVAAIAARVSTPIRPNALSPLVHLTVGALSPPSAGLITVLI
jgi:hypothetical protein